MKDMKSLGGITFIAQGEGCIIRQLRAKVSEHMSCNLQSQKDSVVVCTKITIVRGVLQIQRMKTAIFTSLKAKI